MDRSVIKVSSEKSRPFAGLGAAIASTRGWSSLLLALLAAACSTETPIDIASDAGEELATTSETLSQAATLELQTAFDDAVIYCAAYLADPAAPAHWLEAELALGTCNDPLLADTVKRLGDTNSLTLSSGSPLGQMTWATINEQARHDGMKDFARNGCIMRMPAQAGTELEPTAGFCRADLDYCLAQQLRLKADSFVRAPNTREARDAMHREARIRHGLAAQQYASTLERVDANEGRTCPEPKLCPARVEYTESSPNDPPYRFKVGKVCDPCGATTGADGSVMRPPPGCTLCAPNYDEAESECIAHAARKRAALEAIVPTPYHHQIQVSQQVSVVPNGDRTGSATCRLTFRYPSAFIPVTVCGCTTDRHTREATRVRTVYAGSSNSGLSYGDVALARMEDALNQSAGLAELEATSLMTVSDALTPESAGGDEAYLEAMWGPSSARARAARTLMGAPASDVGMARARHVASDGAMRVLELIARTKVPFPYGVCWKTTIVPGSESPPIIIPPGDPTAIGRAPKGGTVRPVQPRNKPPVIIVVPVEGYIGSEDAQVDWLMTHLPEEEVADFGITREQARAALHLFEDMRNAVDLDYTLELTERGPDDCQRSVIVLHRGVTSQRHPLLVGSDQTNTSKVPLRDAIATPPALCDANNSYQPERAQLEQGGIAGQLQLLRHRLLRLRQQTRIKSWANDPRLHSALSSIERMIGKGFSEWRLCTTGANCNGEAVGSGRYTLLGEPVAGELVLAYGQEELSCLLNGHKPGISDGAACPAATRVSSSSVSWSGASGMTFTVPNASAFSAEERLFVLDRTCQGARCTHRVLDVINPAMRGHIHTLGGSLGELFARVVAKRPNNPGLAAFNSLGVRSDEIPPLVNVLDSADKLTKEGYHKLLDDAEESVRTASEKLEAARQLETSVFSEGTRSGIAGQIGENARKSVASEVCGTHQQSCSLPRTEKVTFAELGLIPALENPNVVPPGFGPHATCVEFMRDFKFVLPTEKHKEYMEGAIGASLRCTRWAVLLAASNTTLHEIPTIVVQTLRDSQGQTPSTKLFAPYAGQTLEELVTLYESLVAIRVALRSFDHTHTIAQLRLAKAVSLIGDLAPSDFSTWMCRVAEALKVVGAVLATVAPVVLSIVTGGAAAPLAAALTPKGLAAIGSGLTTLAGAGEAAGKLDRCGSNSETDRAGLDAYASALDSMEQMRGLFDQTARRASVVAIADARLDALAAKLELENQRAALESELSMSSVLLDPALRAMQGDRRVAATSALRTAQRSLFRARRALEFRLATELGTIVESELANVDRETPSLWSNKVFTADFERSQGKGFDPASALTNYLRDLRALLPAYDFKYRLGEGRDVTVLHLSKLVGAVEDGSFVDMALFKCEKHPTLLPGGRLPNSNASMAPCTGLGAVSYMEASFTIPGPLHTYVSSRIARNNVNYRMAAVGLNVDGRSIFDCSVATDGDACLDRDTLRYDLFQQGAVSLNNVEGEYTTWDIGPVAIRGARALAREVRLRDRDASNLMGDLMRAEVLHRPIAGTYVIRIESLPEIIWTSIEEIEIKVEYKYWTPPSSAE